MKGTSIYLPLSEYEHAYLTQVMASAEEQFSDPMQKQFIRGVIDKLFKCRKAWDKRQDNGEEQGEGKGRKKHSKA